MPRFFVNTEAISEGEIRILDTDAHHIARSLRMAEGDEVTVCDGSGKEYSCILSRIRDEECIAKIQDVSESLREPKMIITLYMAYPKGDKLETVIQKAVELGATAVVPFESSRCIKKPKAEKADKQTARLQRIAEEAAKQCGRAVIPSVSQPISFKEMLGSVKDSELRLICYENEDGRTIKDVLKKCERPTSVAIIVGAEGGFSAEEAQAAIDSGCLSVSLGNRILRCETAPSYALSALSDEYELS